MAVLHEATGALGVEPTALFDGPIDTAVPDDVGTEAVAVLRESPANVARHAQASRVDVEVVVEREKELVLRVRDDGIGPPAPDAPRGKGLANMAARADRLGGTFELGAGEKGSVAELRVPLE
jgi:signal transduction histidine kinase